ncbi:aldehyde ferredoxin oxidoreductase [Actinomycetota bacterium]|nr:aldehyde ferredoxin oxidoreductase [Actinomycetota bacterium]
MTNQVEVIKPETSPIYLPRYALINLSSGKVESIPISLQTYRSYIGGKALATRLLFDLLAPDTDPLAPEAVIIVNTGPVNGTGCPSSSRFNATFKNVLTGGIATTNCGGSFGNMLRKAGYEGLAIIGRADRPVMIYIVDGQITIQNAGNLWGLDIEETQEKLPKKHVGFVIGPSGENLVRYAGIASGQRIAGRCGGGAVFGSKNLKGLVAYGKGEVYVHDRESLKEFISKWTEVLHGHPTTGTALPAYGSAGIVNRAQSSQALTTRNFQSGSYEFADNISGETMAETLLTTNKGCVSCPIRCERRVKSPNAGERKDIKGPEYETLGLFGANVENPSLEAIIEINRICDALGLDTISAAGTIAYAMELAERGGKDFGLRFGDIQGVMDVLPKIAYAQGDFAELGMGSKWLAQKYGGREYAIHSKGLELAAYEPRRSVGMGLGYATSNRGACHLNGGYLALIESVGVLSLSPQTPHGKSQWTILFQNGMDAISASGFCLFSAQTFIPAILFMLGPQHPITRIAGIVMPYIGPTLTLIDRIWSLIRFNSFYLFPHAEALSRVTGFKIKTGDFITMGARCYNLERMFNLREGLTTVDDSLPARLTQAPQDPTDPKTVVPLNKMLKSYYRQRGWDKNGVPKRRTLRRLKVDI